MKVGLIWIYKIIKHHRNNGRLRNNVWNKKLNKFAFVLLETKELKNTELKNRATEIIWISKKTHNSFIKHTKFFRDY